MPIGGKPGGVGLAPGKSILAHGPALEPRLLGDDLREHWLTELGVEVDIWSHWTVLAADLIAATAGTGPPNTCDITITAGMVTRLTVMERSGSATLVGLNRVPTSGAGGYDLINPGSGTFDFGIPATQRFSFRLEAGAPNPTKNLEVWFRAGIHTLRPT